MRAGAISRPRRCLGPSAFMAGPVAGRLMKSSSWRLPIVETDATTYGSLVHYRTQYLVRSRTKSGATERKSAAEDRSFGVAGLSRQRADDHQADERNPAR